MDYGDMSGMSLYQLLEQFGMDHQDYGDIYDNEWADQYSRYFTPYDPTEQEYIVKKSGIAKETIMSSLGDNLSKASNIVGSGGFQSSYQENMLLDSVFTEADTKISQIDITKGANIYKAQKDWAEDFYDTISDLAKVGAFMPYEEEAVIAEDTFVDTGAPIIDPLEIQGECESSGGVWVGGECLYVDPETGEGTCYNQAGGVVDCSSSECISGPCGDSAGGGGGCPPGYVDVFGSCVPDTGGWGGFPSDARLKENIYHVGEEKGLNIYEFNYKDTKYGEGRYTGVMAQELLQTSYRNAVRFDDDGYMIVDYSQLPVNMEKVE